MRRAVFVLALLALTALGASVIQRPPPLWVRGRVTGSSTPPPAPFVQDLQYAVQAPTVPACNWSEACQMSCHVNDAGTLWECWLADAGSAGTVTQGTGTQFRRTQFGVNTMQDVTAAAHPSATLASIDAVWGGDWTVTAGGYGTTLSGAIQVFLDINSVGQGLVIRNEGAGVRSYVIGLGGLVQVDTASPSRDGWALVSLRRGDGNIYGGVNSAESLGVADTTGLVGLTSGAYDFADRQGGGLPLRGPLAFLNLYSSGDAGIVERDRKRMFGLPVTPTGMLTGNATGTLCMNYDGGASECFLTRASMVGPQGLSTQRGAVTTDKMGSVNIDPSTWATVGSPTVTANAASGPFYVLRNQNECAMVIDHDAGAAGFEGNISASGYVADTLGNDSYTFWAYLGQGDSGTTTDKARLQIDVTGGGWDDAGKTFYCDKTIASAGVGVYSCQSPPFVVDAGSPTVKGSILVGSTGADVGAVVACGAALTPRPWIDPLPMTNVAVGDFSSQVINPAAWAFTGGGGKVEVVFSSRYDITTASGYGGAESVLYLFDAYDTSPTHNILMILGYSQPGEVLGRLGDTAGPFTDLVATGVSLTPGSFYGISIEWRGTVTCDSVLRLDLCSDPTNCHPTTSIATATAGTCPTAPTGVNLANRYDNTVPTSTNIYSVTTWHL